MSSAKPRGASLTDFLARLAETDPGCWADALRDDQRNRWRGGEAVRVEDYLRRLPALADHADPVLDLIYGEVLLREAGGERPQLSELQNRFPVHREALARQWEVHQVLEDEALCETRGLNSHSPAARGQEGKAEDGNFVGRRPSPGEPDGPAISGYDLLDELGRGGNGVVYLARQRSLNRLVAIKMIAPGRKLSPSQTARFLAEAELIARLQHPHIVGIHRIGVVQDQPYLVLEYVRGGSLAQRVGKPWPPATAAALVETLARTLAVVHEQGIVHRDLKPANVLLAEEVNHRDTEAQRRQEENTRDNGRKETSTSSLLCTSVPLWVNCFPKIVDFGLAKTLDEAAPTAGRPVTQSGELVGTPLYMAPEQAVGKNERIGPATDQHALGLILYELLTGQPPFSASNAFDMLTQVAFTVPAPPSRRVRGVSADLDAVVLRCLAKEPEQRYASVLELAEDLHRVRHGFPSQARMVGTVERMRLWSRRQPVVAALMLTVLLVLVGGLGAASLQWRRAEIAREGAEIARAEAETAREGAESAQVAAENALARETIERDKARRARDEARDAHHQVNNALAKEKVARKEADLARGRIERQQRRLRVQLARSLVALAEVERGRHNFPRAEEYLDACPLAARTWEWYYLARLCRMRLATFEGPVESIVGVAISPDGRWLASASPSGKREPVRGVWLHDAAGKKSRNLEGVNSVAFRPDGKWLATANPRGGVLLHALKSSPDEPIRLGKTHYRWLSWSPDGLHLAAIRHDAVDVWYFKSNGQPRSDKPTGVHIDWMTGKVRAVAFDPESKFLAVAGNGQVRFWDVNQHTPKTGATKSNSRRKPTKQIPLKIPHEGKAAQTALVWARKGQWLLTGAEDGLIRVYEIRHDTAKLLGRLVGHTAAISELSWAEKNSLLASVAADGTARVWDLASNGNEVTKLPAARAVALSADGDRLLTAAVDRRLTVWATRPRVPASLKTGQLKEVSALAFSPIKGILATGADHSVQFHDPATRGEVASPLKTPLSIHCVAYHPGGSLLAVGMGKRSDDKNKTRLAIYDVRTRRESSLEVNYGGVIAAAFSPDGTLLASAGRYGSLRLWRGTATSGAWKPLRSLNTPKGMISGVAFSPDSRTLASTGEDGLVRLWDVATGRQLREMRARPKTTTEDESLVKPAPLMVYGIAFSPDGKQLATPGQQGEVALFNVASGDDEGCLMGHTGTVQAIVYSPDGQRLATGGTDGTVRLWDPRRIQEVLTLAGHTQGVLALAFSPDGRVLASSAQDRTVLLHEAPREAGR